MAYLGNPPAEAYTNTVKDSFNGDGSTTAFTLSQPSTTNNLRVVVENVIQDPTVAYSCSGTTLTFTSAPPSGTANIYAVHLGPAVMTAVPPTEITNATTYTSALTVQGAFTSPGIDDNATSTTMTIDSSGRVMVGKTATGLGNAGAELDPSGQLKGTAANVVVGYFNRTSSDGSILEFRKDNTTVGSIGTGGGDIWVNSNTTGLSLDDTNLTVSPRNAVSSSDGTLSLGRSAVRWKDLYLSGSVYLGGTTSSNALGDYESGNWTPGYGGTTTNPTVTYAVRTGFYTKIGTLVHAQGRIRTNSFSGGSGDIVIDGLPFTSASLSNSFATVTVGYTNSWPANKFPSSGYVQTGSSYFHPIRFNSTDANGARGATSTPSDFGGGADDNDIIFSVVYYTTS